MKRLAALLFAVLLVCVAADAVADDPTDPKEFWVTMTGLICHITSGPTPRAVIVHGTAIGMPHIATLSVPNTVKVSALRDATRLPVSCEKGDGGKCHVTIKNFSMRIARASDTKGVPVDVTIDPSLDVVPHLSKLSVGSLLLPSLQDDLPTGAAAGFFDMTKGTLFATAFDQCGGEYLDHDGVPKTGHCVPFPSWVTLHGALDEPAVLQIRSDFTLNRWKTIPINNSCALFVEVENRPTNHANHVEDGAHITLYEHLFWDADIPTIELCPLPGKVCSSSSLAAHSSIEATCEKATPARAHDDVSIRFTVPGCDNTQWP